MGRAEATDGGALGATLPQWQVGSGRTHDVERP